MAYLVAPGEALQLKVAVVPGAGQEEVRLVGFAGAVAQAWVLQL